ncbi:MAG: archaellum protein ArlH [Methermicoccaceae archaeon]
MQKLYRFGLERDELEKKLGGGIPAGSLMVAEGENGSGKSTLCQRMAYGFLEEKNTVTYISTQQTTKGFINQMYSLNYPIASHLLQGRLLYIPVLPLIHAPKSRDDFVDRLMGAEKLFDKDVIIIDTLSSLIRGNNDQKKLMDLISFLKKLTGLGKIILMTIDPAQFDSDSLLVFRSSTDIYLQLKVSTMGTAVKHTIFVNKFTSARSRITQIIGFRIEPNVGFVVEISAVS